MANILLFRQILIGLFAAVIFLLSAESTFACSCSGSQTVDIEFQKTPNVAILRLQSLQKYAEGENGLDGSSIKSAKLIVEKVFKGKLKVGQELNFHQGICCVCMWTFSEQSVDTSFLFYLEAKPSEDGFWSASTCSRSRWIKQATADLLYLEKLQKVRGKSRLSGNLQKMIESADDESPYAFLSITNHRIRVVGKTTNLELFTDENGVYEVYDLPPGKYKIFPDKLDGFLFSSYGKDYEEVEVKAKNHTEENFFFEIDNAVSGKVIDANGHPLENVCLDLIPSKPDKEKNYSKGGCTNKDGKFEINSIPLGSYYLAVNKDDEIRIYEPFRRFYYPNVKNKQQALEITVGPNYFLRDLLITPPEIIETITISGVLKYKDGTPVQNETVEFISDKEIFRTFDGKPGEDDKEYTDANGRFRFKIWKGQNGVLRSSIFSFVGNYKNCPQIDELVKQKGDSVQEIGTPDFIVDGSKSHFGIELIFPFSKCDEDK